MRYPFEISIEKKHVCVLMVDELSPLLSMPNLELAISEYLDIEVKLKPFNPIKGNTDGNFTVKHFSFSYENHLGEIVKCLGKCERTWIY